MHAIGAYRGVDFFNAEFVVFQPGGNVTLPIPRKASLSSIIDGRLLVTLDEAWDAGNGLRFAADSVVSYDLEQWKRDPLTARPASVWAPGPRQTLSGTATTRGKLIVSILDNVRGRAFAMDFADGRWRTSEIVCRATRRSASPRRPTRTTRRCSRSPTIFTPQTLWHYDGASGQLARLKATPARFDGSRHGGTVRGDLE